MFSRFLSPAWITAALCVVLLSGCFNFVTVPLQHKEDFLVMPDGSGKMTITLEVLHADSNSTTKEKTAAIWAARPNRSRYPLFVPDWFRGAAAFGEVREEVVAPACIRQSFTVYFEDLNRFQFLGPALGVYSTFGMFDTAARGERSQQGLQLEMSKESIWGGITHGLVWTAFRCHRLEEGFLLDVTDSQVPLSLPTGGPDGQVPWALLRYHPSLFLVLLAGKDRDEIVPALWKAVADGPQWLGQAGSRQADKELAQRLAQGPVFCQSWALPGEITRAEGWTSSEGRTATFLLRLRDLKGLQPAEIAARIDKLLARTILCGPSSLAEQDVAAFRQELEQAKAAWNAWLEEQGQERKQAAEQGKRAAAQAKRAAELEKQRRADFAKNRPLGLLQAARNLLRAGRTDAARERLETILAEAPDSNVAPGAREVLDLLQRRRTGDAQTRLQELIDEQLKAP